MPAPQVFDPDTDALRAAQQTGAALASAAAAQRAKRAALARPPQAPRDYPGPPMVRSVPSHTPWTCLGKAWDSWTLQSALCSLLMVNALHQIIVSVHWVVVHSVLCPLHAVALTAGGVWLAKGIIAPDAAVVL